VGVNFLTGLAIEHGGLALSQCPIAAMSKAANTRPGTSVRPRQPISVLALFGYILGIELLLAFLLALAVAVPRSTSWGLPDVSLVSLAGRLAVYIIVRTGLSYVAASLLSSGRGDSFATVMAFVAAIGAAWFALHRHDYEPLSALMALAAALLAYLVTYFVALRHRPAPRRVSTEQAASEPECE
jgi:hypothetical protein